MLELGADTQSIEQSDKGAGLGKTRVEPRPKAPESLLMEPSKKFEFLKPLLMIVTIIAMILVITGALINGTDRIINASNERIDRLEDALNERVDRLEDTLNKRIDRLEDSLTMRIDNTNKRIDDTNKRIDVLIGSSENRFSLDGSVRGDVESPLTSEIMP